MAWDRSQVFMMRGVWVAVSACYDRIVRVARPGVVLLTPVDLFRFCVRRAALTLHGFSPQVTGSFNIDRDTPGNDLETAFEEPHTSRFHVKFPHTLRVGRDEPPSVALMVSRLQYSGSEFGSNGFTVESAEATSSGFTLGVTTHGGATLQALTVDWVAHFPVASTHVAGAWARGVDVTGTDVAGAHSAGVGDVRMEPTSHHGHTTPTSLHEFMQVFEEPTSFEVRLRVCARPNV